MPNPGKNESQKKYIARCMSSEEAKKSFPDTQQRAAFCFSKWKSKGNAKNDYMEAIREHLENKKKDKK
ncbi:uncharacterized protein METZ01_LOCUS285695 [marine metagenome]|uniref:Uncharacterized protein n=1 Tax=marine metagenome TaxID=408172 RepID=A0A382LD98_9ZZZZ